MPGTLRAFIAVEIPRDCRAALERVQSGLRRQGLDARWVRPENIHLTLKFLGDVPEDRVSAIASALRVEAAAHAVFRLEARGIGLFPGIRRPRVLWVGLSGSAAGLSALQRGIETRLAAIGFPRDEKGFRGHLTLARFKAPGSPGSLDSALKPYADAALGEFEVREVVLFRSDLFPSGAVYRSMERAPLNAGV